MKDANIQLLRALAIIAVVFIHTCPPGMEQVIFRPFINFAVPLFLFLSGYLTTPRTDEWLSFYKKRVLRVLIPYIAWTILYTLPSETAFPYIYNFLTSKACYTLYFILVYIQLTLLTPLIFKLLKSSYSMAGWFITPIFLLVFKYPALLTDFEYPSKVNLLLSCACFYHFIYYYLGLALRNSEIKPRIKLRNITICLIIAILLQMGEGYYLYTKNITNCGTAIKLSSMATNMCFLALFYDYLTRNRSHPIKNIFITLGNLSFGIYLIHPMLLRYFDNTIYSQLPFVINTLVILSLSLLLTLAASRFFPKKLATYLGFR